MLNDEQYIELENLIKESYGTASKFSDVLDLGIEMLFYLEEDAFDRKDVQNVVAAIKCIVGVLRA
ncbi:MAG: hypothetical protein AAF348_01060 [Bacteroidota bacterium]